MFDKYQQDESRGERKSNLLCHTFLSEHCNTHKKKECLAAFSVECVECVDTY